MILFRKTVFTLFTLLSITSFFGQMKKADQKKMLYKGDNLIWSNRYKDAKDIFVELSNAFPEDEQYQFRVAICNINIEEFTKEGLEKLRELEPLKEKKKLEDFNYHYALGHYYNHLFEEAKPLFDSYIEELKLKDNQSLANHVQLLSDYNNNAIIESNDTINRIRLTNLGAPINSKFMEYSPFTNPAENVLVFTYMGKKSEGGKMNPNNKPDEKNGRYYEDVFITYRDSTNSWIEPTPIKSINTKYNDACVGISINGDRIYIYKNIGNNNGDIYEAYAIENDEWSEPSALKGKINTQYWEGSIAVTVDGQTAYFSSDRVGGYGGSDLYSAKLQKDGSWDDIKNLGPSINSQYDEDAPYIHPDNKTLYFSSNGTKSIGNYDVFHAELGDDNKWHNITNAGLPINTLGEDRFYILSADGQTGYLSRESSRANVDVDLFIVTPGRIGSPPLLALITGKVFLDNIKGEATIIVRDSETGEIQGTYKTNPNSDLFTMLLNPGKNYTIDIMQGEELMYTDSLNSDFVDQFIELNHDYYVYSEDFKGEKAVLELSLQEKVQKVYNEETGMMDIDTTIIMKHAFVTTKNDTISLHGLNEIVKENRISFYEDNKEAAKEDEITPELLSLAKSLELTDNVEYNSKDGYKPSYHNHAEDVVANTNGEKPSHSTLEKLNEVFHPTFTKNDLVYRVQVAAYRKPENYRWDGEGTYGDVLEVTYADGITRFTIGGTMHLAEVNLLRKKLIESGIEDAFVVAFKGEERIPLYELIKKK